MIRFALAAASLFAAPPTVDESLPPQLDRVAAELLQVTVQQIIIRVPRRDDRVPAMSTMGWRESNGPRCIPAHQIAAAMPSPNNVDLLMRDNSRIRARLGGRCTGLGFYRGLYVDANPDGRLCAGRDEIRSRMGGRCDIVQFRTLRPAARAR